MHAGFGTNEGWPKAANRLGRQLSHNKGRKRLRSCPRPAWWNNMRPVVYNMRLPCRLAVIVVGLPSEPQDALL